MEDKQRIPIAISRATQGGISDCLARSQDYVSILRPQLRIRALCSETGRFKQFIRARFCHRSIMPSVLSKGYKGLLAQGCFA